MTRSSFASRVAKLEALSGTTADTDFPVFVRWIVDPGTPGGQPVDPTHAVVSGTVVSRQQGESVAAFTARACDAAIAMREPGSQIARVLMLDGEVPAEAAGDVR